MAGTALLRLRQLNRAVAILVGIGLLLCAAFILAEVLLRQTGISLGGTDEISGYTMAIATSWGMAYCMLELGHVRIDVIRARLGQTGRVFADLLALLIMAGTVSLIAFKCWPVLERSLKNSSKANTPLETPLAWVQGPWFAGWVWFALMAWATLICALMLVLAHRKGEAEAAIGVFGEAGAEMGDRS